VALAASTADLAGQCVYLLLKFLLPAGSYLSSQGEHRYLGMYTANVDSGADRRCSSEVGALGLRMDYGSDEMDVKTRFTKPQDSQDQVSNSRDVSSQL